MASDSNRGSVQTHPLRNRILTAGVLAPLLIGAIFHADRWPLALLLGLFLAAAAWEWSALSGLIRRGPRAAYAVGLLASALLLDAAATSAQTRLILAGAAVIAWVAVTVLLARIERGLILPAWPAPVTLTIGMLVLLPFWLCVLWLKDLDFRLLLGLAALVWLADSLAYFAGHRWGRHRLAPHVSPGKTWEGVAGALVAAPLVAVVLAKFCWDGGTVIIALLSLLGIVTIAISIVGDLFESLFKRRAGVKDSGRLLPGHGGVMDRIDSLTAAAPMFYLGVILLGARA